jgi:hypothetical protein
MQKKGQPRRDADVWMCRGHPVFVVAINIISLSLSLPRSLSNELMAAPAAKKKKGNTQHTLF